MLTAGYVPRDKEFIKSVKRGNISELIRSLQKYPHLKPEYSSYYQKTYEETTPNWKFPTVRNLEEYLVPFAHCLVHVTNIQNVDVQQHSVVPIIMRHHTPAKIIDTYLCRKECLLWLPPAINVTGAKLATNSAFDCPLSKYIKDTFSTNGLCSSIVRWNFALNIRPWNCEVTVALFPPFYVYTARYFNSYEWRHMLPIHLLFSPVWNPTVLARSNKEHFISNVFNILILDELYEVNFYMENAFKWKENIFRSPHLLLDVNQTLNYVKLKNLTDKDAKKIMLLRWGYVAMSEVFKLISDFIVENYVFGIPSNEYNRLKILWRNSKLLPELTKLYKNVEAEVKNWEGSRQYYQKFHASLSKLQERHAFEILKKCNKVAVILPALTCHQIARNLSEIENLADVYVGEELLYNQSFRIRISGSVPHNILMRAKHLMASGIWDFWSEIFRHEATFREDKSSETQLVAPSMSGNISVVFTIILFGFACAVAVFVIEIRKIIYDCGMVASKLIKNSFIYLVCAVAKYLDRKQIAWIWVCNNSDGSHNRVVRRRRRRRRV
ncbi:unnamed protein product [Orchesella dallaii]|uniref:Uncharacterized protein n=1 Tax=Orchesella dallaii TaxID=48710 RepID=A0ABP1QCI4_9HEXA